MRTARSIAALLAGLVALGVSATNASAATLQGEIGFIGTYAVVGGTLADATGLSFPNDGNAIAGTADFAGQVGATVSFNDISFAAPAGELFTTSSGLSFTLTSLVIGSQTASALDWTATGFYSLAGFDDTAGTFSWSGDSSGGLFTYSATGATTVVPLPGALVLFGSALAFFGRRRRALG